MTEYRLNSALLPITIEETEQHELTLKIKPEVGTTVMTQRILKAIQQNIDVGVTEARTVKEAIAHLQPGFREVEIDLQIEGVSCPDTGCPTVSNNVKLIFTFHCI